MEFQLIGRLGVVIGGSMHILHVSNRKYIYYILINRLKISSHDHIHSVGYYYSIFITFLPFKWQTVFFCFFRISQCLLDNVDNHMAMRILLVTFLSMLSTAIIIRIWCVRMWLGFTCALRDTIYFRKCELLIGIAEGKQIDTFFMTMITTSIQLYSTQTNVFDVAVTALS